MSYSCSRIYAENTADEKRSGSEVDFRMSVTVRDCLNLPSLNSGKVVAGEKGLDSIVASVSVLEFDDYEDNFYIPNGMIITSFYCAKDDVDEQCRIIRHCKKSGDVGLILFYSDVILKGIDGRLIETADECNFPIIVLRGDDMGLVYSDVIADIMEEVITDRQSGRNPEMNFKDGYSWEKSLISGILDGDFDRTDGFARNVILSASEFDSMIVITCRGSETCLTTGQCARVKKYLDNAGILHVADVKNGDIVIMARNPDSGSRAEGAGKATHRRHGRNAWSEEHIKGIRDACGVGDIVFSVFENVTDVEEYGHGYRLVCKTREEVMAIFPQREMISLSHLRFAARCRLLSDDEESRDSESLLKILEPLMSDNDRELAETLAAYMLDADFEVKRAAELMYMHRNTILYRIRKANILLNEDIHGWPFCHELYSAIALWRLKNERMKRVKT